MSTTSEFSLALQAQRDLSTYRKLTGSEPIICVLEGSRGKGYAAADSDYDIEFVFVPSAEVESSLIDYSDNALFSGDNKVNYRGVSLRSYLKHLAMSDPQSLDILTGRHILSGINTDLLNNLIQFVKTEIDFNYLAQRYRGMVRQLLSKFSLPGQYTEEHPHDPEHATSMYKVVLMSVRSIILMKFSQETESPRRVYSHLTLKNLLAVSPDFTSSAAQQEYLTIKAMMRYREDGEEIIEPARVHKVVGLIKRIADEGKHTGYIPTDPSKANAQQVSLSDAIRCAQQGESGPVAFDPRFVQRSALQPTKKVDKIYQQFMKEYRGVSV